MTGNRSCALPSPKGGTKPNPGNKNGILHTNAFFVKNSNRARQTRNTGRPNFEPAVQEEQATAANETQYKHQPTVIRARKQPAPSMREGRPRETRLDRRAHNSNRPPPSRTHRPLPTAADQTPATETAFVKSIDIGKRTTYVVYTKNPVATGRL